MYDGIVKRIAWWISRIFEPVWEVPLIVGMAVWYTVQPSLHIQMLAIIFLFDVILPGIFLATSMKKGKMTDWDVTNRKEREGAYLFTTVSHLVSVIIMFFIGQVLLGKMLLVLWTIIASFMIINHYWKISVHAGVNALLVVFMNSLYGWKIFGWMSVILILVLWSRVKIRKHTTTQVMIGAALAMAMMEFGLRLLDII